MQNPIMLISTCNFDDVDNKSFNNVQYWIFKTEIIIEANLIQYKRGDILTINCDMIQ